MGSAPRPGSAEWRLDRGDQLARSTHRHVTEVIQALTELTSDGLVEVFAATTPSDRDSLSAAGRRANVGRPEAAD